MAQFRLPCPECASLGDLSGEREDRGRGDTEDGGMERLQLQGRAAIAHPGYVYLPSPHIESKRIFHRLDRNTIDASGLDLLSPMGDDPTHLS